MISAGRGVFSATLDIVPCSRSIPTSMLARNYAKPFCIAGFILAEIYMLLLVLAPYGHDVRRRLPAPIPIKAPATADTRIPPSALATRIVVSAFFFGPFGALVGLGAGLVFSGIVQVIRREKPGEDVSDRSS